MTDIMLTPLGWPIAFGLFGAMLVVGGWIADRLQARADRLDRARRRHPSGGPR